MSIKKLPILNKSGLSLIAFPMTQEDYDLMMQMLFLWKKRIVEKPVPVAIVSDEPNRDALNFHEEVR